MALINLSSAQLAHLIGLVKEKESLQSKLDQVNAQLHSLETGKALSKKRGRKPGRPAGAKHKVAKVKTSKRGKRLKQPLLKALSAAGSSGITVKELAKKLKVKPGNIFSWFYTTGKKISGIKKVGEAKYAYTS
jgi:ribosomal protein L29